MQEDKEPLFDTIDTVRDCLELAAGVIRTMSFDTEAMRRACGEELLATDLADYLVRKGVPFRTAHELVGRAVQKAEERGVTLRGLSIEEYRAISPAFDPDLYDALSREASVAARDAEGGTAPAAVRRQLEEARRRLAGRAAAREAEI
jgi:argininosuccinate lyase